MLLKGDPDKSKPPDNTDWKPTWFREPKHPENTAPLVSVLPTLQRVLLWDPCDLSAQGLEVVRRRKRHHAIEDATPLPGPAHSVSTLPASRYQKEEGVLHVGSRAKQIRQLAVHIAASGLFHPENAHVLFVFRVLTPQRSRAVSRHVSSHAVSGAKRHRTASKD
jgi:hypothetical protein